MPTLGAPLDFAKLEGRNLRAHQLGTAPASPVTGQLYYNTGDNTLYWYDGTGWVSAKPVPLPDATSSVKGVIQLAGDLSGTAASPQIATGVITDSDVNAANKDGAVGVYSMRTLGAGASQAMPGNRTLDAVPAPATDVNLNNKKIVSLVDPVNPQDAATKAYVDATTQGLDVKQSVKLASTGNVALPPGGATFVMDSVATANGDRVLLKNQTTPSQNGIYVVSGLPTSAVLTRSTDANTTGEITGGMFTFVESGSTQADTGWVCTNDLAIIIDSSAINFAQFSGAGSITAGAGLTQSGTTIDAIGTANRIIVGTDTIDIASNYVGQASITTLGTIGTGTWNGTTIAVANGGTGQTTVKAARETGLGAAGYYSNGATHGAGTVITITQAVHGLRASRSLYVQVQDNATGAVEIPDISVAANGDITVTYAAAVSANTKLVTVVG